MPPKRSRSPSTTAKRRNPARSARKRGGSASPAAAKRTRTHTKPDAKRSGTASRASKKTESATSPRKRISNDSSSGKVAKRGAAGGAGAAPGRTTKAGAAGSDPVVAAFINTVPEKRRDDFTRLHEIIQRLASELGPAHSVLKGKGIGYGKYHYKYASGREGDWFVLGIANNAQHICLHSCMCTAKAGGMSYLAEKWEPKLGKVNCGRSCVRFSSLAKVNLEGLEGLIKETVEEFKKQYPKDAAKARKS